MAKTDPRVQALGNVDLFSGLSPKELKSVLAMTREVKIDAGEAVTTQGEKGGRCFVILEGEVDVVIDGDTVDHMGPGAYFGEMSLLDGERRSATVVGTTPLVVLSLASFNFKPLLREYPSIAEKLLATLSRRVRSLEQSDRA